MKSPPLRLEDYFYTDISVQVNPEYDADEYAPDPGPSQVKTGVKLEKDAQDPRRFQLHLSIGVNGEDGVQLPYLVQLNIIGLFVVADYVPEEEHVAVVRITGASLLYSAAREFVLTLTGRGPWEPMLLPTISFIPQAGPARPPTSRRRRRQPK